MFPNISLNRRMPNGTSGGVRGASNPSPYSIVRGLRGRRSFNPRTREGCDLSSLEFHDCPSLRFNPRTREGCDSNGFGVESCKYRVSIHAPVKGATI